MHVMNASRLAYVHVLSCVSSVRVLQHASRIQCVRGIGEKAHRRHASQIVQKICVLHRHTRTHSRRRTHSFFCVARQCDGNDTLWLYAYTHAYNHYFRFRCGFSTAYTHLSLAINGGPPMCLALVCASADCLDLFSFAFSSKLFIHARIMYAVYSCFCRTCVLVWVYAQRSTLRQTAACILFQTLA